MKNAQAPGTAHNTADGDIQILDIINDLTWQLEWILDQYNVSESFINTIIHLWQKDREPFSFFVLLEIGWQIDWRTFARLWSVCLCKQQNIWNKTFLVLSTLSMSHFVLKRSILPGMTFFPHMMDHLGQTEKHFSSTLKWWNWVSYLLNSFYLTTIWNWDNEIDTVRIDKSLNICKWGSLRFAA